MASYRYGDAEQSIIIEDGGEWTRSIPKGHPHYRLLTEGIGGPEPIPPATIAPFVPPIRRVFSVSSFQAKAALLAAGLLDDVEAMVQASTDPVVKLAWAEARTFERYSPTVLLLANGIGLSEEAINNLFDMADTITA